MINRIKNMGKKFAHGSNSKQRYIYGRENINWAGPQRAAEEDAAMQREDFMDIARDFTETTNAAAVAYEEGDMKSYEELREEAARIYAAHKYWDHFAQTRPEKKNDVLRWREEYSRFRYNAGLSEEHDGLSITNRYNMLYDDEDWEHALQGIEDAIFQYDNIKEARKTYRDRVNGDRKDEESPAEPVGNDDHEDYDPEYSDRGPRLNNEDYTDLSTFFKKIEEVNYPQGAVMTLSDDDRAHKIMRSLVAWGLCKDEGNNNYSLSGSKEDFEMAYEEVSHRAAGGQPTRPVHGGKYLGSEDGEHAFQKRPEPTDPQIREMLIDEETVAVPYGSEMHTMSDEHKERFLLRAIAQRDIPCTVKQFQVEETGEIISIDPNSKVASYQKFRQDLIEGKEVDPNAMMAMFDDGFLPSDYSASTRDEHYSNGRLSDNPYNTSATTQERPGPRPHTGGGGQQPPRGRGPRPQAGSGGNGRGGGGGHDDPPTQEFPSAPDDGDGYGGPQQDMGDDRQRSRSGTSTKSKKKKDPLLNRGRKNVEDSLGLSKFGASRLTGRKRVGPFVINTGFGGVAGVSSVSLKVGPIMWSLWSKNKKAGFSSIDLPGMLSFRGNRKRK